MSLVELQQYDGVEWRSVRLSRVWVNDDGVTISGRFRILVDGEEVYRS